MSVMQHAWLGNYEVSSTTCTGLTFARHSHDECVIGANLVGEEKVWLDRREFDAGPGSITLYNPGQIQGGGAADGAPWQFVSLYATADQLAADLGLAHLEFDRSRCFQPDLAQRLADAVKGALSSDALVRERYEEALVLSCFLIAALVNLLRQNASPTWQRVSYALCGLVLIYLAILAALGI